MDVMLIHGQGRSSLSLRWLGWQLRRRGHRPHYFDYFVACEAFERIQRRFERHINQRIGARPYVIVGHSLGGIIARASLAQLAHPPLHLLMLGPPNHPALIAQRLRHTWLYRQLTGDCGQKLADAQFYASLPLPQVPTTIIAGTRGLYGRWLPFGSQPNDGIVRLCEADLGPDYPLIQVPAIHTLIINHAAVIALCEQLLQPQASASGNDPSTHTP